MEGIVDPAVSRIITELEGYPRVIFLAQLIADVDSGEVDPHAGILAFREASIHVIVLQNLIDEFNVKIDGFAGVLSRASVPACCLHRSCCGSTTDYDCLHASLVRHELDEVCTCRVAKTIS